MSLRGRSPHSSGWIICSIAITRRSWDISRCAAASLSERESESAAPGDLGKRRQEHKKHKRHRRFCASCACCVPAPAFVHTFIGAQTGTTTTHYLGSAERHRD